MPCRDWGSSGISYYEDTSRVDKLARIACELARAYEKRVGPIRDTNADLSRETRDWWQTHKRQDEIRARREQEERARKQERKKILTKLTPAERKAIGVEI